MYYLTGLNHVKICRPEKVQGKSSQIIMNKFLSNSKQQTTVLCDQTCSVIEDTPKPMNTADPEHTKKSHQNFPLALLL